MKKKIAFVVIRYGQNINGGAEYHCQMLAERLVSYYDVEVITTCVKDMASGDNEYPEGVETMNNVLVRRFNVDPIHPEDERINWRKSKYTRRLRQFLFHLRLLKFLSFFFPVWRFQQKREIRAMNANVLHSPKMCDFIRDHVSEYKVFIAMSLDYSSFYYTAIYAGEKTVAIPTLHYSKVSFRSLLTSAISKVAYVGFNSGEELKLGERIFGRAMKSYGIISVGIETSGVANWEEVKKKYQLPERYLLYVGRITAVKLYRLLPYFLNYRRVCKDSVLKLVLVGGLTIEKVINSDVIYTGFISDEEKMAILQHAEIVINPSNGESLSLILLEAMNQGKPMLVNGRCKVLKEHCYRSNGAAVYYKNKMNFNRRLRKMEKSEMLRNEMGEKGKRYVMNNYSWDIILNRITNVIESF